MNRQRGKTASILYVVFVLSSEYYGTDMKDSYRVLPMDALIRVSHMPPFLKGVVNLRGVSVPVLDLRTRLDLPKTRQTAESRIVIASTAGQYIGFIVDAVTGVSPIPTSSINEAPVSEVRSNYLSGTATLGPRQVFLIDLNKVSSLFDGRILATPANDEPAPVR
ncbi:MAG TPA: purine-binding chemotaxis protein CheW [Dehalococcoidia bacterium]|nr:purine-binding chemotaxis protein CheW [Dehalococcoidia bacterium]